MSIEFIIIILLIPFFGLMMQWFKAANDFRDLYQKKVSPEIPISDSALTKGFVKNPGGITRDVVSGKMAVSWASALFGRIEDQELRFTQSKARKYLLCTLLYMIALFLTGGMILYFSNR